jgi:hypothetical protein
MKTVISLERHRQKKEAGRMTREKAMALNYPWGEVRRQLEEKWRKQPD